VGGKNSSLGRPGKKQTVRKKKLSFSFQRTIFPEWDPPDEKGEQNRNNTKNVGKGGTAKNPKPDSRKKRGYSRGGGWSQVAKTKNEKKWAKGGLYKPKRASHNNGRSIGKDKAGKVGKCAQAENKNKTERKKNNKKGSTSGR